ncbi:unnamed protein product [Rangifer tarandus platyrhynchus]|uniref:Uncharacterized protein n=1 Tax=Rangifer tarandus platyrhynchus TaxID=3082113 RepID=A0AC60A1J1_RANTA
MPSAFAKLPEKGCPDFLTEYKLQSNNRDHNHVGGCLCQFLMHDNLWILQTPPEAKHSPVSLLLQMSL